MENNRFRKAPDVRSVSRPAGWLAALALVLACAGQLSAEVERFEITRREPFAGGKAFGEVGPYERIVGKVTFSLSSQHTPNRSICDLEFAPRGTGSRVVFEADLDILAPRDLPRGNGALLYDVNNRGNKLAIRFFNDGPGENDPVDAGHGFLMRHGFTIVWSGWDGELLAGNDRLQLSAPVACGFNNALTGPVRYEIVPEAESTRLSVNRADHGAYRPYAAELQNATLSWRMRPTDPRQPIPRNQFRLHVTDDPEAPAGQLPLVELELPAGFQPGYLYELIYEAQDPLVHGVCFASVRDLLSAFKYGGGAGNPLLVDEKPVLEYVYGFGVSQSGRFLREMLYSGFNEDEQGRKVFDGIIPHVAGGGMGSFNHRFAQPTAFATQYERHDFPTDRFPFAYGLERDPLPKPGLMPRTVAKKENTKKRTYRSAPDGILMRVSPSTMPKILHTQSSTEYWSRSGSLVHTDPSGERDSDIPENVRVYAFGGTQHGPEAYPPEPGIGQALANPADYRPFLRSLLLALDRWCRADVPPPASVYPKIAAGELVDFRQTGFPAIPGVRYPEVIRVPQVLDLGARWEIEGIIDRQPPGIGDHYVVKVPRVGEDGNELGCLLPPEVAVPLASFTGWNLRGRQSGAMNQLVGLKGSYIPLLATAEQRVASGDPRLSLEERYHDEATYLELLTTTCRDLVRQGYLLEEDVPRIIERQRARARPMFEKIAKGE